MTLINSLASWIIKKRIHQIELFKLYPIEVQQEWFLRLINESRFTEWGIRFNYADITSINQFKETVPIQDYNSLKPFIDRLKNGQQNILWPTDIKWFAKSSGTTNDKSKFIPVSIETLEECHYKGGKDMLSIYINNHENTKIFTGKALMMGGSHQIIQMGGDSYTGDLSAIIMQNMPFWAQFFRSPDLSVALMDKWEQKIEKMCEVTMRENITNIAGVPSWTMVLFNKMLEKTGAKNISEVWPNLELYMHGGVSFVPYRQKFNELLPNSKMNYFETYNASEGFFGIEDVSGSGELLLMLDYGIFYEFLPVEEYGKEFPKTLQLDEIELNKNYALVISTNSGLWRYLIGDTIKFVSKNPFRIKITGRTKHFINAFGEELIIENAEEALKIACEKTNAAIVDYTAGPIYMDNNKNGGHEWLIEFEHEPENLEYFTEILDNALKSINSDYEAKRYHNYVLKMPLIHKMPKGTFYNWLKSKDKLGGQNKVPRLANNREYLDAILRFKNQ